ncbi:MAG: CaiB/BaiF CoA transferase family protein [Paracoccaceae bacterium]|mgnify:CR=1 FL=1
MTPLLQGIRVVDLTTVIMGPFATAQLGVLGADVIKVESAAGDNVRHIAPMKSPAMGAGYLNSNRGKRSVVLDLKSEEGRGALLKILETADVFVTNMRRQALDRLGLDRKTLCAAFPKLIHCCAVGFGRGGPYENDAAYDDVVQALSGFASVNADAEGAPRFVPQIIVDKLSGLFIVEGVLSALVHRERTGKAVSFELPMMETASYFLMTEHLQGQTHQPPIGPPGYARLMNPYRRPYRTADGFVAVLPYADKHWPKMLKLIGREEVMQEDWFQTTTERSKRVRDLYQMVDEAMPSKTTSEWLVLFRAADIPCGEVNTMESLLEDPQIVESGVMQRHDHPTEGPLQFMRHPADFDLPRTPETHAPTLGEHTREVLRETGMTDEDIAVLVKNGNALQA